MNAPLEFFFETFGIKPDEIQDWIDHLASPEVWSNARKGYISFCWMYPRSNPNLLCVISRVRIAHPSSDGCNEEEPKV